MFNHILVILLINEINFRCLVHLSREGASVEMFAPNINQLHVIDHTKGKEDEVSRNVLVESARIARGNINSLDKYIDYFSILILQQFCNLYAFKA